MRLYYPIEVDLYKPYPLPIMEAQQNNIGRGAQVTLKANGAIIQPTNEGLTFWAKKPDGTVSFLAATLSGTNVQLDFTNQMLALPGMVQVEIRMTSGSGADETDISTPIFNVRVNPSNIDDTALESTNEFTALVTELAKVTTALAEVEELKKNGLKGDPGQAATIEVGTATASEPGGAPSVTNVGTEQAAILDFVLPRGEQGPKGADGAAGKDGKEQIVFAAASSFPTTGDPAMLYVDNTVSPAIIYTWNGSAYVQASADIGTVMAMLATPFSTSESYSAGKYVTYNGQYWRFTADKTAGAWDASKAEATNIGAELNSINTKIAWWIEKLYLPDPDVARTYIYSAGIFAPGQSLGQDTYGNNHVVTITEASSYLNVAIVKNTSSNIGCVGGVMFQTAVDVTGYNKLCIDYDISEILFPNYPTSGTRWGLLMYAVDDPSKLSYSGFQSATPVTLLNGVQGVGYHSELDVSAVSGLRYAAILLASYGAYAYNVHINIKNVWLE